MLRLEWRAASRRLALQWVGGGPATAIQAQPSYPAQLAAVIGPQGRQGDPGPAGELAPAATLVVDVDVAAGTPLAINRATGRFVAADALIYTRAVVVGLAAQATLAGFAVDATGAGSLTLTNWTAVTGAVLLLPGQLYFLREGGGVTMTAPSNRGSSVAPVAEATSPTTLNLRRSSPILL